MKKTVQPKLGEDLKNTETPQIKSKLKIVSIEDEIKLNNDELRSSIKKQNTIDINSEGIHMRVIKRMVRENMNDKRRQGRHSDY